MNRRDFIGGICAFGGILGLDGGVVRSGRKLRFGVVSDLHVDGKPETYAAGDCAYFSKALKYFKQCGVDAVMVAGDFTDHGYEAEMNLVAKAWFDVFPENSGVEKLFVTGNHDMQGRKTNEQMKKIWERVWREPYENIWHKTVKGYHFIGQHWGEHRGNNNAPYGALGPWLQDNDALVRGDTPFFYVQHAHPKGTCNGPQAWGHDAGHVTKALSGYPNAVVFSGHSHYSHLDERSIWQGAFTSVNAASLRYGGHPDAAETGRGFENGGKRMDEKLMPIMKLNGVKSGLLVDVYSDAIVYSRRDFQNDCKLGPDWVQSLPAAKKNSLNDKARIDAERLNPPAFSSRAVVKVSECEGRPRKGDPVRAIELSFPAANAGKTRVFSYMVRIASDGLEKAVERRVLSEGFCYSLAHPSAKGESRAVISMASIPLGEVNFEVYPVSSLGVCGKPICTRWGAKGRKE